MATTTTNEPVSARAPTGLENVSNNIFRALAYGFGSLVVLLLAYIVFEIFRLGSPAMAERGFGFTVGRVWNPNANEYGILPEIWGTLFSSVLGILFGSILGVSVAIFLSEGFLAAGVFQILALVGLQYSRFWSHLPEHVEVFFKTLIQLLAAIPSVVYGLWGIFVVIPMIRPACNWLHDGLSWIPFFGTPLSGPGILPASIVLAIMVLPIITSISYEAFVAVPPKLREAAYGLGATRWETIMAVLLPTAAPGLFGAIILAFGRALGETMALAMLVGNSNVISLSVFSPANTLAALLANNFGEAGPKEVSLLMYAALILLLITLGVNVLGSLILQRVTFKEGK